MMEWLGDGQQEADGWETDTQRMGGRRRWADMLADKCKWMGGAWMDRICPNSHPLPKGCFSPFVEQKGSAMGSAIV